MTKIISEPFVEESVRKYLGDRGWKLKPPKKSKHHGGPDIDAFHPSWRKRIIIEAKGEGKSTRSELQVKHNAFPNMLGQIISRMNIEGNAPNRAKIYAVAFPQKWTKTFQHKVKEMEWAWKSLRLKVFLVYSNGDVDEVPYSRFLRYE
jgi:hypothetical protein